MHACTYDEYSQRNVSPFKQGHKSESESSILLTFSTSISTAIPMLKLYTNIKVASEEIKDDGRKNENKSRNEACMLNGNNPTITATSIQPL